MGDAVEATTEEAIIDGQRDVASADLVQHLRLGPIPDRPGACEALVPRSALPDGGASGQGVMDADTGHLRERASSAPIGDIVLRPAREAPASVVAPRRLEDAIAKESDGVPVREAIDRDTIGLFASRKVPFDEREPRAELHVIRGDDG